MFRVCPGSQTRSWNCWNWKKLGRKITCNGQDNHSGTIVTPDLDKAGKDVGNKYLNISLLVSLNICPFLSPPLELLFDCAMQCNYASMISVPVPGFLTLGNMTKKVFIQQYFPIFCVSDVWITRSYAVIFN
jgi:hypothetical protein